MTMTDPIADILTRICNANVAMDNSVRLVFSEDSVYRGNITNVVFLKGVT